MTATSPHQALYRRWRAQTFGQIVGQDAIVATLRNAVRSGRVAHALLFVGPRGTGKTSMARIIAKALNCAALRDGEPDDTCAACVAIREGRALDVIEMDAASNNRVDDVRELLKLIYTAPSDLRRKVFIVDEVQRIKEGWDVLLKTLEEPPDHVTFVFCTTDSSQIRPAVLSRVQRFDFRRLTVPQIEGKLRTILEVDGRSADPDALSMVARLAQGGMRDAESMLDQLLAMGADRIEAGAVRDLLGLADEESVTRYVDALSGGDPVGGLDILDDLEERGRDLRVFLDQVVETLRAGVVAELRRGDPPRLRALAATGRRLAAIDYDRLGPGGLRLQLELLVLTGVEQLRESPPLAVEATLPPGGSRTARSAGVAGVPAEPRRPAPLRGTAPAAPPPAAPPPSPAMPGSVADDDLSRLVHGWPEIVDYFHQAHKPTYALVVDCRPVSADGNLVTLGFPESKRFLGEIAEKRRSHLEEGIGRFLGRPVAVRCVATNVDVVPTVPGDDGRLLAEARRIFADDLADVGEIS